MEKINIAELLKDCPSGMELDCTIWNSETKVFLKEVRNDDFTYPIVVTIKDNNLEYSHSFTKYGAYNDYPCCKCVLFPKGKTTWEGFQRPFKDGDIVATQNGIWIGIHKRMVGNAHEVYLAINHDCFIYNDNIFCFERLATEEEKQRLFQAIKDNGYKWNEETKTLEKLIEPKFKVGDRITSKILISGINTITKVCENYYELDDGCTLKLDCQDRWELVSNKFDITTLVPFESRVLVRNADGDLWKPAIYGFSHSKGCYVVGGIFWRQCIPYEVNKELLGTTNDCDEYYKTWE